MKKKDVIVETKSEDFALRIINLYRFLTLEKKEWVISKQILKSGTSIGANIAEAEGALSDADFSAKISVSYKESLETKYWIRLLFKGGYIDEISRKSLYEDADELCRMLFTILKSMNRVTRTTRNH